MFVCRDCTAANCSILWAMASYDLTAVLAKNLDKHLVFPLLEFLSMRKVYPEADIEKAKIELVNKTNMIDFLMDIWQHHHNAEPPEEFLERRAAVVERLEALSVSFPMRGQYVLTDPASLGISYVTICQALRDIYNGKADI